MKTKTKKVIVVCTVPNCPRTLQIPYPEDLKSSKGKIAYIQSECPWHTENGMKEYPEYYFDAKGRRLDWETWKPYKPTEMINHLFIK
jgi:hypothetical protein